MIAKDIHDVRASNAAPEDGQSQRSWRRRVETEASGKTLMSLQQFTGLRTVQLLPQCCGAGYVVGGFMPGHATQPTSRRTYNAVAAAACLIAVSFVIASLLPPLERYAALMWGLALLAFAGAALAEFRSRRDGTR